ncbi:MAG: hypothetical protein KDI61_02610, partial [Alphaproteobacteria bacterium]|nr:hypothetical protein [Alphaproteobacteria bacterium]
PALSTKMSEEGTSIELGEEQTRKLAIMARLLRTNEFQTILGALRFPDTKLVATPSQPEYLRFLKSLTEFGMAQRVNSPTNVQHMPAEVQNTLNYFKLNADAKKAIAGILKAAKPEEAVDIDAKLGL